MVIVLFEYRMRSGADLAAYERLSEQMNARVAADEAFGYIDQTAYDGEDGSTIVVERFRDPDSMGRWANDPGHRAAQLRGRDEFYEWYRVRVLNLEREYSHGEGVPA